MDQTDLEALGRSVELRFPTVADTDRDLGLAHRRLDHARATARHDHMVDGLADDEYPLPPGVAVDARSGFIAADDCALLHLYPDGLRGGCGGFRRACDDASLAAVAEAQTEQVLQGWACTLVTEMLLVLQIDHRRFQAGTKAPRGFQSFRQTAALQRMTDRAEPFGLPRFNHDRAHLRQLGQLSANGALRFDAPQVRLTVRAGGQRRRDHGIGLVHPSALGLDVAQFGAASARLRRFRTLRLAVARGRYRRIL